MWTRRSANFLSIHILTVMYIPHDLLYYLSLIVFWDSKVSINALVIDHRTLRLDTWIQRAVHRFYNLKVGSKLWFIGVDELNLFGWSKNGILQYLTVSFCCCFSNKSNLLALQAVSSLYFNGLFVYIYAVFQQHWGKEHSWIHARF